MAGKDPARPPDPPRTAKQLAKQAGLFLLFGTILIIPRLRRLRRRVAVWTCLRLAAVGCGAWLLWRFTRAGVNLPFLLLGLTLLFLGLFVRSTPEVKSVDSLARELNALVALNGGAFFPASGAPPLAAVQIFVHPERLIVVGARLECLAEIPLAGIRSLILRQAADKSSNGHAPWEVGIDWAAGELHTAVFRYEGAFAEHLARVTESTVRSQWKKELPVIQG